MDAGFVDDLVVISRPNLPVFPVFFPVIRNLDLETGSNPTASSASQSSLYRLFVPKTSSGDASGFGQSSDSLKMLGPIKPGQVSAVGLSDLCHKATFQL
jgi:hypothetical protein